MSFNINVNNTQMQVQDEEILLTVLRRNGIRIPTLCQITGFTPAGACRLCVVEVEGKRDLITSCTYPVEPGMIVKTNTQRVIKARKAIVEMLLANHPDDCLYCERNGNCELQWLAEELHVKERRYYSKKNSEQRDHSSPSVYRDPSKCILCNRCVRVCEEMQLVTAIEFVARGNKTRVNSAFNKGLNVSSCIDCGQCIMYCPTGALVDISHIEKVQSAINNQKKTTVAMISPGFTASVAEHLNIKTTDNPEGLIIAALKHIGFNKVFDTAMASDLNIILEASRLKERVEKEITVPLLSSCCPSWVEYAEEFMPGMLPDVSNIKSPQQLMGRLVKYELCKDTEPERLYTVALSACVANKFEAAREENTQKGISETDAVITVREFLRMMRSFGLNILQLQPEEPDMLQGNASSAGFQMSYSGGKAEAVAYQLNLMVNGKSASAFRFTPPKNPGSKREVKVKIGKHDYGFAWVSGIAETAKYLEQLKAEGRNDIHYIEIMACPGGCAGGGGQPIVMYTDKQKQRKKQAQELEKLKTNIMAGLNQDLVKYSLAAQNPELDSEFFTQFHKRDVLK